MGSIMTAPREGFKIAVQPKGQLPPKGFFATAFKVIKSARFLSMTMENGVLFLNLDDIEFFTVEEATEDQCRMEDEANDEPK
jgi:hypothetical protein